MFTGVVHGKTIELEQAPELPEFQAATVIARRSAGAVPRLPFGDGLRRAAGAWADDETSVDAYLNQIGQARGADRPPMAQ